VTADRRLAPHAHHLRVQRTARYYTLGGGSSATRQVWFALHGYGQLAGEFIRYFADLADDDTLIVAPEAMNRFYLVAPESAPARERPVGATWMTREDRECEIADYVEYLDALYDDVAAELAASGATVGVGVGVGVIGFSQGSATATRWVAHGRVRVSRLVLWGGMMPPETDLTPGPLAFHDARVTLVIGERDHYIDTAMVAAEEARLRAAGISFDTIRFEGGHAIKRAVFDRLRAPL
jgi:predicted esterase